MKIKSVQSIHPCKSVIQTNYDIVKAHHGELKVDTEVGKGTSFVISLPIT
jgi:signal transduction histidine kinase